MGVPRTRPSPSRVGQPRPIPIMHNRGWGHISADERGLLNEDFLRIDPRCRSAERNDPVTARMVADRWRAGRQNLSDGSCRGPMPLVGPGQQCLCEGRGPSIADMRGLRVDERLLVRLLGPQPQPRDLHGELVGRVTGDRPAPLDRTASPRSLRRNPLPTVSNESARTWQCTLSRLRAGSSQTLTSYMTVLFPRSRSTS